MASKKKPAKVRAKTPAPWRWFLVEALLTTAARYRMSGDVYPWWFVRLTATVGRTPVSGHWTVTDTPINLPLRVLVRLPGWASAPQIGFGFGGRTEPADGTVKELTRAEALATPADLDHPLYNVTTINL